MPQNIFEGEVNNLIEWCEDLDYDKYMDNWFQLATSSKVEVPADDSAIRVYKAGLGELTVGINEQMSGRNSSNNFDKGFIQNSANSSMRQMDGIGTYDGGTADPFKGQKVNEDTFLKTNLEYEKRLKEHQY